MNLLRGSLLGTILGIAACGGNADLGGTAPTALGGDGGEGGASPVASAGMFALGSEHACALEAGKVRCWGVNRNGELGDGTNAARLLPGVVPGLDGVVAIATDGAFDLGDPNAGRGSHTCAILGDSTARCWGPNLNLDRTQGTATLAPTPLPLGNVRSLALGTFHSCALTSDGHVSCWGDNGVGQLGVSETTVTSRPDPAPVPGLANVVGIAAGEMTTCALMADGTVQCWGRNFNGELGDGTSVQWRAAPAPVVGLGGVTQISGTWTFFCARLGDGTARCWGDNTDGVLGDGSTTNGQTPSTVKGLTGVVRISAGTAQTCALLADASVRCWGSNNAGQLGTGGYDPSNVPVPVALPGRVVDVDAGKGLFVCAKLEDGRRFCWGDNGNGQLGDGTTTFRATPTLVLW